MGAYVVGERIVRDGRLVAYEGQVMSEAEAASLGLIQAPSKPQASSKPQKPKKPQKKGE